RGAGGGGRFQLHDDVRCRLGRRRLPRVGHRPRAGHGIRRAGTAGGAVAWGGVAPAGAGYRPEHRGCHPVGAGLRVRRAGRRNRRADEVGAGRRARDRHRAGRGAGPVRGAKHRRGRPDAHARRAAPDLGVERGGRIVAVKVGFVGAGAAGGALARALAAAGVPVVAVTGKGPERAHTLAAAIPECAAVPTAQDVADRADLVVLAVPDRAIAEVCASVRWRADAAVVHCSGAHSLDVLEPARAAGALVGGCHPLQTLTGAPEDAARLAGSVFGIEAEEPLRGMLADLVERIGGRPVFLSARDKALYHASAVLISNYTVTLAATAAGLWEAFGVDRRDGLRALLPLLRGTVANL